MTIHRLSPVLLPLILLVLNASYSPAQVAALATNPSATPFFKSAELTGDGKKQLDFTVRAVGSVRGRVCSSPETPDESTDKLGIMGVKVSLKSRELRYKNFVIEQFTDEIGAYLFENLPPGDYMIEIDPKDLPQVPSIPQTGASPLRP